MFVRHSSGIDEELIPETSKPKVQSHNNDLLEEIRQHKHKSLRKKLDNVINSPGRFSFLRKKVPATPPPEEILVEFPAIFPKRQASKEFEFDMSNEVEHEKNRLSKLPPGGENIWASV